MKINFSPPDIRQQDIDEVVDTLRSGWITTGPKVNKFESMITDYCESKGSIVLSSATAALEMTLRILGIGEGDEVITSSYTYSASASVIDHVGAKIVLVDTYPNSYFMNLEDLESKITDKTKAIIPVNLGGVTADLDEIISIAKKHKIKSDNEILNKIGRISVIVDAAHSFGSTYKGLKSGNIADFTCFSFHAVKNLTTAEGGAITWREDYGIDIFKKLRLISLHGQNKLALEKSRLGAWEYDIVNLGYKYNMTDIQASLGISQLNRYDEILKIRENIVKKYNKFFDKEKIEYLNHFSDDRTSSYHLYLIQYGDSEKERNDFIDRVAEFGVPLNVHYKPLPMMSGYIEKGFNINDYKNAFNIYKKTVTLPLHTLLTEEKTDYILDSIKKSL
ncbi:MAG: capsular biosynthesis protein [Clostridiales bacterium]|nr:MAG: capsular biosynthesis protein [Clostridiales bacterium]